MKPTKIHKQGLLAGILCIVLSVKIYVTGSFFDLRTRLSLEMDEYSSIAALIILLCGIAIVYISMSRQ